MTVSALSATTSTTSVKLVALANGEYTAGSVASDPTDASRLWLVKEKDGNYGVAAPAVAAASTAAAQSASGVLAALASLKFGGQ